MSNVMKSCLFQEQNRAKWDSINVGKFIRNKMLM